MRVRGQVPESAAVLVLQRTALHDKPVGLSLDKVVHVQRGYFTLYRCAICVHTNLNNSIISNKLRIDCSKICIR